MLENDSDRAGLSEGWKKFTCFGLDFYQVQVTESKTAHRLRDPDVSPFSVSSRL